MIFNQIALLRNNHDNLSVQSVCEILNIEPEIFYNKLDEFQYCTQIEEEIDEEKEPDQCRDILLNINLVYHVLMLIDTPNAISWRKELVEKTDAISTLMSIPKTPLRIDFYYLSKLSETYSSRQISQIVMRAGVDLGVEIIDENDLTYGLATHVAFNFFSEDIMIWKDLIIKTAMEFIPEKLTKQIKCVKNSWAPIDFYDNDVEANEILKLQSEHRYGLFSSLSLAKLLNVQHRDFQKTIEHARDAAHRQNFTWTCEVGWTPIGNRNNSVQCVFIDKNLAYAAIMLTNTPTATRWKYYIMSLL